jgi:error-prone DNA polymerase
VRPFASLADLVRRVPLSIDVLTKLAEAGAFEGFLLDRRQALWEVRALKHSTREAMAMERTEATPHFAALDPFETVGWDYRTTFHSPRGHPLASLRGQLRRRGLPDARTLNGYDNGRKLRFAGMVICRQRPATANGVVFMTLEDETGFVNLVIWQDVFKKHTLIARTSNFLGITGKIQAQDGVVHLIAEQLWKPELDLKPESGGSRDFH